MSIYLEEEYKVYLTLMKVGSNDKIADSKESYIDYLNLLSKELNIEINFETAGTTPKAKSLIAKLRNMQLTNKSSIADGTISNIATALMHYKEFAIDYAIYND